MAKALNEKGIIEVEQAKRDIAEIRAGEISALDMFARILSIDGSPRMTKLQQDLGVFDRETGGALTVAPEIYLLIARKAFEEYKQHGKIVTLNTCRDAVTMAFGTPYREIQGYSVDYLAERLRETPPAPSLVPEV